MDVLEERKKRLHGLIDLARVSRGWSRAQLGRALGRDATKIYPESGNPKADFLIRLAEVLEWSVGDVIDSVWGTDRGEFEPVGTTEAQPLTYRQLYDQARAAHQRGDWRRVVDLGRRMFDAADTPELRAIACISESVGWDGLGRYMQEVEAAQRGLREHPVSIVTRNMLRAALANAWYSLWDLTPALGTAEVLVKWYEANPPERRLDWKRVAYVHYVRGNTLRRLATEEPDLKETHYRNAARDLARASELYTELSREFNDISLAGIANTCKGAIIEVETELGLRDPGEAVSELIAGVLKVDDAQEELRGDWLESYGWWATFACDIALRHLSGRELQTALRVLNQKGLDIADRLGNWAMRERVFTLQFSLHRAISDSAGLDVPYTVPPESRSLIAATMGRFPSFRSTGWEILNSARIVEPREEVHS